MPRLLAAHRAVAGIGRVQFAGDLEIPRLHRGQGSLVHRSLRGAATCSTRRALGAFPARILLHVLRVSAPDRPPLAARGEPRGLLAGAVPSSSNETTAFSQQVRPLGRSSPAPPRGLGAAFARALADRGLNPPAARARGLTCSSRSLLRCARPRRGRARLPSTSATLTWPRRLDDLTRDLDVGLCVYQRSAVADRPVPRRPARRQAQDRRRQLPRPPARRPCVRRAARHAPRPRRSPAHVPRSPPSGAHRWSPPTAPPRRSTSRSTRPSGTNSARAASTCVLVCCAGATRTPGFERSSGPDGPRAMTPHAVVAEALQALGGPPSAVPGGLNRLAAFVLGRLFPRRRAPSPSWARRPPASSKLLDLSGRDSSYMAEETALGPTVAAPGFNTPRG